MFSLSDCMEFVLRTSGMVCCPILFFIKHTIFYIMEDITTKESRPSLALLYLAEPSLRIDRVDLIIVL